MAVDGVFNNSTYTPPASHRPAPDNSSLQMEDFMKLLAKQLENQDMNSPMTNSEMMGQLTSMATVQSMNTFSELSSTQYALNLIGQSVKVTDIDESTNKMEMKSGIVTGINLSNMTLFIEGNSKGYGLGNVMEVGTVPEAPKDEDGDGKPDDPVDPADPNKPDNPDNPDGPGDGTEGGSGDKTEKSVQKSGAAAPDGRAAAFSARGAAPDTEAAASGTVTTLPDGRASVPVGRSAAGRRTATDDRTGVAGVTDDKNTSSVSKTSADSRSAASVSRTPAGSRSADVSGSRTLAPGGRSDTPGMAQDKREALAAQASRTIPADKAASLERDRQMRSRIQHIGPGSWD